jgi:uncharacterized repeat protein (TIGR03803 family)
MQSKRQHILFALTVAALLAFLLSLPVFAATTEQVLYSFNASGEDGAFPLAGLIFDKSGNLYGTTAFGGADGAGAVFQLVPGSDGTWTENVLHSFGVGSDGQVPYGGLIMDSSGNLYGTATGGGTFGDGAVFELIAGKNGTWTEQVLHSFGQGQDGQSPEGGLVFDNNGNLYGTTIEGGGYDDGTVFELTPGANGAWTETVVHTFTPNGKDGLFPEAGLIFVQGYLLGTTYEGGAGNVGTVFALARNKIGWAETVLHSFEHNGVDGYAPEAALTLDGTGTLIGTTTEGGTANDGTVFGLTQNKYGTWVEEVLYSFNHNNAGGSIPFSGVLDKSGNLYGTTFVGGQYSFGTVFELTPGTNGTWTENVLHAFDPNGQDGLQSEAGVIFDTKGNLYGTTTVGGTGGNGAVFEVLP